jgi:putative acetyltransferase
MFSLRSARPEDCARNFEIWRTAVTATHHFLSPEDFDAISALVRDTYLPMADLIVAVDADDLAHGFLGGLGDHIDALFVHAESRSRGIGRQLVKHFLAGRTAATVDVNEQNHAGRGFYERLGFEVFDRSEQDDDGRPYPLLKLRYRQRGQPDLPTHGRPTIPGASSVKADATKSS